SASPATFLPPELLLQIFHESIPRRHECDPSIMPGPNSIWARNCIRTKKSLPLVCRGWNAPATELLYSDVVFRRFGQIVAFAETLRTSLLGTWPEPPPGRGLAALVKRMRIDTLTVHSRFSEAVQNDLAYILEQCTQLRAFEYHPTSALPILDDTDLLPWNALEEFSPGWMFRCTHVRHGSSPPPPNPVSDAFQVRLRSGIRELDLMSSDSIHAIWYCSEDILHLHNVFTSAACSLVSLKLGEVFIDRFGPLDFLNAAPLELPALRELFFHHRHDQPIQYVSKAWSLPRLDRCTLVVHPRVVPNTFLAAHGRLLRFLHFYPEFARNDDRDGNDLQDLADVVARSCPVLEHLVLPTRPVGPLVLRHQTLRYIDVWSTTALWESRDPPANLPLPDHPGAAIRAAVLAEAGTEGRASDLPALQTVRLLLMSDSPTSANTYHLPGCRHPEWPVVCDPESSLRLASDEDEGVRCVLFANAWAVQTEWGVLSLNHPLFQEMSRRVFANGHEDRADEADLLDGIRVDDRLLRIVLEEQGLEYSAETADAEWDPELEISSESDTESDEGSIDWDGEMVEDKKVLQAGNDRMSPVRRLDREQILEGFRRGSGVVLAASCNDR
ncbi:hypothetical protein C8Q77DRAFT_1068200, partial [Trametes polyzona]